MESFEAFDLSDSVGSRRLKPGGRSGNGGSLPMRQLIGQHPSMATGGTGGPLGGVATASLNSWGREEGDDYSQHTVMPKFEDENSMVSFMGENEYVGHYP